MSELLYLLDLEGTTGIYTKSLHVNDTIQLRAGFKELVEEYNRGEKRIAITTRAPRYFVDVILENLCDRGIDLDCKVYTGEDLEFASYKLGSYKDYSKVYSDHDVDNPCKDVVVLGDFIRFDRAHDFSASEYRGFDFSKDASVFGKNHALNDHPFSEDFSETPVYAVLPQLWTTYRNSKRFSLNMGFVMDVLEGIYSDGDSDFGNGFKRFDGEGLVEAVESDALAKNALGIDFSQRYLVFKGEDSDWECLEEMMDG
ncbi:hypothetical protein HOE04_00230 [archaeon]|jgi:hypothetical protein|nr:hypothetical protein [archaeon]